MQLISNMNKIYFLSLLALSLLLLGCVQQTAPETKYVCADGKTIVTDVTACPAVAAVTPASPFAAELAVCSGMPLYQSTSLEDWCIMGIAAKHKDTSLCLEVIRDQRLNCYALVAELKADPDTCSESGTEADRCFQQYATDKKDDSVCDKISDASAKDSCYNSLASQLRDPELCGKIKNLSQKDSCYFSMAMSLGDTAYCDKISNESQKQNCTQNLANRTGIPMGK